MTSTPLILIHGALHNSSMWDRVINFLPQQDVFVPTIEKTSSYHDCVNQILSSIPSDFTSPTIIGYSMGARIAALLTQKINYSKLILVSGTLGITNKESRSKRVQADKLLAKRFSHNFQEQITQWMTRDIFLDQTFVRPQLNLETVHSHLINLGQGNFTPIHDIPNNTSFVVGSEDEKYLKLAKKKKKDPDISDGANQDIPLTHPQELVSAFF